MECIDYMFIEMSLDGFVYLDGVKFSTTTWNLVNTLKKKRVQFIFDASKYLL
jgi:hypothetical protein